MRQTKDTKIKLRTRKNFADFCQKFRIEGSKKTNFSVRWEVLNRGLVSNYVVRTQ